MTGPAVTAAYNYSVFNRENALPWLNFEGSPSLGEAAPDFPLWQLDGQQTSLGQILGAHRFTVVEFGSFT